MNAPLSSRTSCCPSCSEWEVSDGVRTDRWGGEQCVYECANCGWEVYEGTDEYDEYAQRLSESPKPRARRVASKDDGGGG